MRVRFPLPAFMSIFIQKVFKMHSGGEGHFKIECDGLTDEDWATLAFIVSRHFTFSKVVGVPRGGLKFAEALAPYVSDDGPTLIVDDVLTTGRSMEEARAQIGPVSFGVVAFARGECPRGFTQSSSSGSKAMIDFERGAKTTGSKFYFLTGDDAVREMELCMRMTRFHQDRGYVPPSFLHTWSIAKRARALAYSLVSRATSTRQKKGSSSFRPPRLRWSVCMLMKFCPHAATSSLSSAMIALRRSRISSRGTKKTTARSASFDL